MATVQLGAAEKSHRLLLNEIIGLENPEDANDDDNEGKE